MMKTYIHPLCSVYRCISDIWFSLDLLVVRQDLCCVFLLKGTDTDWLLCHGKLQGHAMANEIDECIDLVIYRYLIVLFDYPGVHTILETQKLCQVDTSSFPMDWLAMYWPAIMRWTIDFGNILCLRLVPGIAHLGMFNMAKVTIFWISTPDPPNGGLTIPPYPLPPF